MLESKRVRLRPVRKSDAEKFVVWMNNPGVTKYLMRTKPITDFAEQDWIESVGRSVDEIVFTIEAIDSKKSVIIGSTGIHKIDWLNRSGEFGIVIGNPDYWENGYGTEITALLMQYAFNSLNLHRISSSAYAFNKRSVSLHRKLGFSKEGVSRKAVFKNGKYHDVVNFSFLRKKYKKLNK